ncbi:MAG: zinc-dependent alcohol dehydrogenase family protein [Pseudomonadota bacterium]
MKQVQLTAHGAPPEVCKVVDVGDRAPGPGQAAVRVMACGINPADLLGFEGRYPGPGPLPAPCGIEGAGVVEAVGEGGTLSVGDHVIVLSRANWAEVVVEDEAAIIRIPKTIGWRDAAQMKINPPTAEMMLSDYVDLKEGDWVIQNAANSAVGLHLIRFAKERGVKTVNLVRREELVAPLKDHGGDVVILGGEDQAKRMRAEIGDDAHVPLGIDAAGGVLTRWMADACSDGATIVNYGYLDGSPCEIEPGHLIVRRQTLTGFWLAGWMGGADRAAKEALYERVAAAFESGRIISPVEAEYGLDRLSDALAHAWSGGRSGKILLTPNGPLS